MVVVCARKTVSGLGCLVTTNMDERRVALPQGHGHLLYDTLSPHAFILWRRSVWFGRSILLHQSLMSWPGLTTAFDGHIRSDATAALLMHTGYRRTSPSNTDDV